MTGVCPLCGRFQSVRSTRGSSIASARCNNDGRPLLSIVRARNLLGLERHELGALTEAERATRFSMIGLPEINDA